MNGDSAAGHGVQTQPMFAGNESTDERLENLSPLDLLFTHSCIEPHFRESAQSLDSVVDHIVNGQLAFGSFPPMNGVWYRGKLWLFVPVLEEDF